MGALELLIQTLATPPPLSGGAFRVGRVCRVSITIYSLVVGIVVRRPTPAAPPLPVMVGLQLGRRRRQPILGYHHGRASGRHWQDRLGIVGVVSSGYRSHGAPTTKPGINYGLCAMEGLRSKVGRWTGTAPRGVSRLRAKRFKGGPGPRVPSGFGVQGADARARWWQVQPWTSTPYSLVARTQRFSWRYTAGRCQLQVTKGRAPCSTEVVGRARRDGLEGGSWAVRTAMDLRCRKPESASVASVHQAKNAARLSSGMAEFPGTSEVQQPCRGSGLLVSRSCDAMEFRGE